IEGQVAGGAGQAKAVAERREGGVGDHPANDPDRCDRLAVFDRSDGISSGNDFAHCFTSTWGFVWNLARGAWAARVFASASRTGWASRSRGPQARLGKAYKTRLQEATASGGSAASVCARASAASSGCCGLVT